MDKKIYIVLSQTGAITSKVLRLFTHDKYNHVSISLTPTLEKMYSFGRRYSWFPFIGGFVEEGKNIGTFKRFTQTEVMVLEVIVSEDKYNAIKYFIEYFLERKKHFKYSYWGVFMAAFKRNYESRTKFYCSQFVRMCLALFGVDNAEELPKVIKPIDFLKLNSKKIVYTGLLRNYYCI